MKNKTRRVFIKKAIGSAMGVASLSLLNVREASISAPLRPFKEKRKVLLDTDIGTDADDAVCLAYLLLQERCDLIGVTTVGMDSGTRAQLVEVLSRDLGSKDLPISAGCDAPFLSNLYWNDHKIFARGVLNNSPPRKTYMPNRSVEFMRDIIRQYPKEVTLLAVGPLTNVAALLRSDPHTFGLLEEIIIMGGRFRHAPDKRKVDCNFMLDPASGASVHQHINVPVRIAGVEETGPLGIARETMERWFDNPAYDLLLELCKAWIDRNGRRGKRLGLHDPFAAALLFEPDLCEYQRGDVGVQFRQYDLARDRDIEGDELTGYTTFVPNARGAHRIVIHAKREKVHRHLEQIWK